MEKDELTKIFISACECVATAEDELTPVFFSLILMILQGNLILKKFLII